MIRLRLLAVTLLAFSLMACGGGDSSSPPAPPLVDVTGGCNW